MLHSHSKVTKTGGIMLGLKSTSVVSWMFSHSGRILLLAIFLIFGNNVFSEQSGTLPSGVSQQWWSKVQRGMEKEEFRIQSSRNHADSYEASNRRHNFDIEFKNSGVQITPMRVSNWQWGLQFREADSGFEQSSAKVMTSENRIEFHREGIIEWYVNSNEGLEQGFTVYRSPSTNNGRLLLDLSLMGNLHPKFASDGQSIDFYASSHVNVLHYANLKVHDGRGDKVAARFIGISGGIRIEVDSFGAVFPITIDPLATTPAWLASGDEGNDFFGYVVATAGDVNGDGYSDILVSAPYRSGVGTDSGKVYLFEGSPSGLSETPNWVASGTTNLAFFGQGVASAGDVNGDGYSDVIIGAPDGNVLERGKVYVYCGSPNGLSTNPLWTVSGDEKADLFGSSVSTAGDINGDGYSDILIGAYAHDAGSPGSNRGRVYLYLGSNFGPKSTPIWVGSGNTDSELYGYSVATAGDINGDGYSDFIIGAPLWDPPFGGSQRGMVEVYLGSSSGKPVFNGGKNGQQDKAQFGISVASAGDVNGDGYSDIIVGADYHDGGGTERGQAYVYPGSASGLDGTLLWKASGVQDHAYFGNSVSSAGDVNGDGYADIVVGSYFENVPSAGGLAAGTANLFLGSANGPSQTADWIVSGDEESAELGFSVSIAGDVNGDGFSDLVVGAVLHDAGAGVNADLGRAYAYYGSPGGLTSTAALFSSGDEDSAYLGSSIANAGDVNGDGYADILVGAPYHDADAGAGANRGRAYIYFGSSSGFSTSAKWFTSGDENLSGFGASVAGAGDVNGDGFADIIIGANSHDAGAGAGSDRGRAYVYFGSPNGPSTTPSWVASGDENEASFGFAVSSAGDINGDGYSDIIIGAPLHDAGAGSGANRGRVYVYLGSPAGPSTNAAWMVSGDETGDQFGYSVANAGDVNGDGYSDVLIGAPFHPGTSVPSYARGLAYLYAGSPTGMQNSPKWTGSGTLEGDLYGYSLNTAGDVNGDGFSDILIGAPKANGYDVSSGTAYLLLGSPTFTMAVGWLGSIAQKNASYGASLGAWDVNGDGYSDVVIGIPFRDLNGGADQGSAFIYLGSPAGPPDGFSPSVVITGSEDSAYFGSAVAGGGDVNGDGYSDVVIGAPSDDAGHVGADRGRVFFYYGNERPGIIVSPRQLRASESVDISPLGLAYNQNARIGMRLRNPFGRSMVTLEYQMLPLGTTFNPLFSPIQRSSTWWNSTLLGSTRYITLNLDTPDSWGPWMWRIRTRYPISSSPFQSHGPWFSPSANGLTEMDFRSTALAAPPACFLPDEPDWLYSVIKNGTNYTLNFQDPNQSNQRTGWNIRRSNDPALLKKSWPLVGSNVVDMDSGTVNYQWTDHSNDDPGPGNIWYYQVTTYNDNCPGEGPF